MDVQTPCPDPSFWKGLLDGTLPPAEEKLLHAHLETCLPCQATLQGLAADSGSWNNLHFLAEEEPPAEVALREIMASLAEPRESAETATERNTWEILPLNFLDPADHPRSLGRLGPYEVLEWIGRGGMGVVLKARDPKLDRLVAIKVMAPELAAQAMAHNRFLREARAAAAVRHENVVAIYTVDEARGLPYLVMEYISGGSLEERLLREGPLPLPELLRVGVQVAAGLAAAHARGLVHRDIKPANVLWENGHIKITDFGLARAIDDASLSGSGLVAGTPEYMAPEQARGEFVDHRADLFSLGSLLYVLGTGQSPFHAGNPLAVLRRVSDDTPAPVNELNPSLPHWLASIIARLQAKAPVQRFSSAAEVGNLLERHLLQLQRAAQPVADSSPPTLIAPAEPPPPRRSWKRIALAACLLFGLAAAGSLIGYAIVRHLGKEGAPDRALTSSTDEAGDAADQNALARLAQEKLTTYCHRCHGQNGAVEGGMNYLMDRDQLVLRKKIVPGQPENSHLLQRIEQGEMPPEDEQPRPGVEDIALLRRWIAAGAPAFAAAPPSRPFITNAELVRVIEADLRQRSERDRRFTRYFTLTHLWNAGLSADELQTYRNGLAKLLNSLSWEKKIAVPAPVDPAATILRIDLRDYRWSQDQWDLLLVEYPYAITPNDPASAYLAEAAATRLPYLRGDWFVATASRPPLYHQLLKLPDNERELEKLLHIDAEADIRAERVARAGFNDSGVSRNNRLIERHETSYGAYWKSYDFARNDGEQNLFERPLGPGSDERSFRHVGGEIIFNLPNGLQGYLLINGKGQRIDKGPTDIVSDPKRPDRAVENGLSCMSCHSRGINPKKDQVRAVVEQNRQAFADRGEVDTILALYPPADKFDALLRQDAERFQKAAAATGAKVGATEPIMALAAQFEAPLDLRRAAAETGLEPPRFLALLARTPNLGRTLGALKVPNGTLQRQTFAQVFPELVSAGELGTTAGGPLSQSPAAIQEQPLSASPAIPEPKLPDGKIEVKLPEAFAQVRSGGGGRYLILYLKKAKKLAIFDVSETKVVQEIDAPEDVVYAAGRDKLMVVLPGQRLVQRWNFRPFRREKIAPLADTGIVTSALMGCNGRGPLLLFLGDRFYRWDVEKMEQVYLNGEGLGGSRMWNFQGRISADGQVVVTWHGGISGQQYVLVRPGKTRNTLAKSPDAHSFNGHWAMPNADGSLIFRYGGGIYDGSMKALASGAFSGAILLPTEDPRFFLAIRGESNKTNSVALCTSADLRPVCTVPGVEKVTGSILNSNWGHINGEPRIHYLPSAKVLVNLPESNDRVVLRRLDLIEELNRSGQDYLFVLSRPETRATAGSVFTYRMDIRSKASLSACKLESGPEGMTVSGGGVVRWAVPAHPVRKSERAIVTVRSASGKEIQHSFDLVLP